MIILSKILVLMLAMSLSIPAFADPNNTQKSNSSSTASDDAAAKQQAATQEKADLAKAKSAQANEQKAAQVRATQQAAALKQKEAQQKAKETPAQTQNRIANEKTRKVEARKAETSKVAQVATKKAADQKQAAVVQAQMKVKTDKIIKSSPTIQKQVESHKAVAAAAVNPTEIKNEADKTTQLKKLMDDRLKSQPPRPLVPPLTKKGPTPKVKDGIVFGVKPTKQMPRVSPPNPKAAVRDGHQVPSALANDYTFANHKHAADHAQKTTLLIQNDKVVVNHITSSQNIYKTTYETTVVSKYQVFNNYYFNPAYNYRYAYQAWYGRGFVGGYYYPVRQWSHVEVDFLYPTVHWLYVDSWAPEFYSAWYGEYYYVRVPVRPFRYVGVWYPSETLRFMALDVAGYGNEYVYRQENFRTGMTQLTDLLSARISENMYGSFVFGSNEIVLTHYENIKDLAYEVDGFVDRDDMHIPFKGLIDLENPSRTMVYVPLGTGPASDANYFYLDQINRTIDRLGWDSSVVYQEPDPVQLDIRTYSCTSFSGDSNFSGSDVDVSVASSNAINACTANPSTNNDECNANVSCDDGSYYSSVFSCTSTSNNLYFTTYSRDVDLASIRSITKCTGDATTDNDGCSAFVSCTDSDGNNVPLTRCTTSSLTPDGSNTLPFQFDAYDANSANNQIISACQNDPNTDNDQCRWNVQCFQLQ